VIAGVPTRIPEVTNGDLSSNGTIFLFTVISAFTNFSASFPEILCFLNQSTSCGCLPPEMIS
jgi:hypothetical protein